MVARVNTVAFEGIDVRPVDVQVQISSGLPAFTIVGPINPDTIKDKISYLITMVLMLLVFANPSFADDKVRSLFGAEYVPQNQIIAESFDKDVNVVNRTLSFVLRIEKGDMCCHTVLRNIFLNFDAYNKTGEKVSTMRFGDAWSNGVSRQGFSTYQGMYCTFGKDRESDCTDMKSAAGFYPIGVNKDLSPADISDVPDLLILPDTYGSLTHGSYQHSDDWDKYIKFYTQDKIYPDFRGYDFWVRKKCGEENL